MKLLSDNYMEFSEISPSETAFEDFETMELLYIVKEINKDGSRSNRIKLYEEMLLKNMFLYRRTHDIGFFSFLCRETMRKGRFLDFSMQYVRFEIVNRLLNTELFYNPHYRLENWEQINNPKNLPNLKLTLEIDETQEHIDGDKIPKSELGNNYLKYLDFLVEKARKDLDFDLAKAIKALKQDFDSKKFRCYEILLDPFGKEPFTKNAIDFIEKKMDFTKLVNTRAYFMGGSIKIPEELPELQEFIYLIAMEISNILAISIEQALNYNKFINDLISNIHIKWFQNHTIPEKWNLLSNLYEYHIDFDKVESTSNSYKIETTDLLKYFEIIYKKDFKNIIPKQDNLEVSSYYKLLNEIIPREMLELERNFKIYVKFNLYDLVILGYDYLLSKLEKSKDIDSENKDRIRTAFYAEKAWIYYQKMDYSTAKSLYLEAMKSCPEKDLYIKGIIIKNLAEISSYSNNTKDMEYYIDELKVNISKLNGFDRYQIMWNLSNTYRRLRRFTEEYKELLKISSSSDAPDMLVNNAMARIMEMENVVQHSIIQDSDFFKLDNHETKQKIEELRKSYQTLINGFFVEEAEAIIWKIYKISPDKQEVLREIISFYITIKKHKTLYDKLSNINFEKNPFIQMILQVLNYSLGKDVDYNLISSFYKDYTPYRRIYNHGLLDYPPYDIVELPKIMWLLNTIATSSMSDEKIEFFIDNIIQKLEGIHKIYFIEDIGSVFTNTGFFEIGMHFYQLGLNFSKDNDSKSIFFNNIAMNYYKQDNYDLAMENIEQAHKLDDKSIHINANRMDIYEAIGDIPKARKVLNELHDLGFDTKKIKEYEKKLDLSQEAQINLNLIENEEVKNIIHSAELISMYMGETDFDIDFSLMMLGYCKAMEILLDEKITKKINLKQYTPDIYSSDQRIKSEIYKKLNPPLKYILLKDPKTIGVGQWILICSNTQEDVNHFKHIPFYVKFLEELKTILNKDNLIRLKEVCVILAEYRNDSAHVLFADKNEYQKAKPKIIGAVNEIISIIHNKLIK